MQQDAWVLLILRLSFLWHSLLNQTSSKHLVVLVSYRISAPASVMKPARIFSRSAGAYGRFNDEYDKTSYGRSWNTSLNLPYAPADLAKILAGFITDAGAEIRYETPAVQLVTDDAGAVTGVIVKSGESYEQYNCAKGVVLATGGYEYNEQMLRERCRPRGIPGHWLTAAMGNTGDGHRMGLAVGAAEDDFPQAIMLDPEQLMPLNSVGVMNTTGATRSSSARSGLP